MANIAKKIIRENGFDDVITVVPKNSMDLSAPQGFAINILFSFQSCYILLTKFAIIITQFARLD